MAGSAGIRMCLPASGLNNGVLQYCKNRVEMRLRSPTMDNVTLQYDIVTTLPPRDGSGIPLIIKSASLSISSTMSLVSLQSCSYSNATRFYSCPQLI